MLVGKRTARQLADEAPVRAARERLAQVGLSSKHALLERDCPTLSMKSWPRLAS